jgi:8-oxo-dGTP diphosphatase
MIGYKRAKVNSAKGALMQTVTSILCRDILGNVHIVPIDGLVQRSSVYGVVKQGNEALLVSGRTSNGRWDLPGGGIKPGEKVLDALRREIKEETNLELVGSPKKICEFKEYFYDVDSQKGWESTRSFYEVEYIGTPRLVHNGDDIVEGRFFAPPFADEHISPVTREVLRIVGTLIG